MKHNTTIDITITEDIIANSPPIIAPILLPPPNVLAVVVPHDDRVSEEITQILPISKRDNCTGIDLASDDIHSSKIDSSLEALAKRVPCNCTS